jgi:hypothetical protein
MGTPYNNDELIFYNYTNYTLRFVGPFSSTNPDHILSFPNAENLVQIKSGMSWKSYKNGNVTETYLEIPPNSVGTGINTKQKNMVPKCKDQDLLFTNILTKNQYKDCGFVAGTSPTNDYLITFVDSQGNELPSAQVWIREPDDGDIYLWNADGQYLFYGAEKGQPIFQIYSYYNDSTFYFTVGGCNPPVVPVQTNTFCLDLACSGGPSTCSEQLYEFIHNILGDYCPVWPECIPWL